MTTSVGPNLRDELSTLRTNYHQCSKLISARADAKQIHESIGLFFTFLDEHVQKEEYFPVYRLYEINVILRHPSMNNKGEVFATVTSSLAKANKDLTYWGLAANLNDVTVDFMNTAIRAERAAGAIINSIWPPAMSHSSLVPFLAK